MGERPEIAQLMEDRLAALAKLAGGVAHEVNNPLAFIIVNLHYARQALDALRDGPDPERLEAVVDAIGDCQAGAQRISEVVERLRLFSRSPTGVRERLDLSTLVANAVELMRVSLEAKGSLRLELGAVPPVVGNEAELAQVVCALLENAADALPEGDDSHEVVVRTALKGAEVLLEISDTGPGVPPEVASRIFDPFYSGHEQKAGLGLAVAYGVAQSLGGSIELASGAPGRTTFRLRLPTPQTDPMPLIAEPTQPERSKVLIVDDEVLVGKAVSRLLRRDYEVVCENSAHRALERLRTERFDVILVDLNMPAMDGVEFFHHVAGELAPQHEVIVFMTGDAQNPDALPGPVLPKPVDPARLRNTVAEVAETGSAS